MKSRKGLITAVIICGVLTAVICGVMNLYLIPAVESEAGGLRCFDMRFGYSFEDAAEFLRCLSAEGRGIYLSKQLPLDFVYPLSYGCFFTMLIYLLSGKKSPLCALPVLLALLDYTENICVINMLKGESLSASLVKISSAATVCKTLLMYLCFAIIIALILRKIILFAKRNKGADN